MADPVQINVRLSPEESDHLEAFRVWLARSERWDVIPSRPAAFKAAAVMGMSFAALEEDSERSSR